MLREGRRSCFETGMTCQILGFLGALIRKGRHAMLKPVDHPPTWCHIQYN